MTSHLGFVDEIMLPYPRDATYSTKGIALKDPKSVPSEYLANSNDISPYSDVFEGQVIDPSIINNTPSSSNFSPISAHEPTASALIEIHPSALASTKVVFPCGIPGCGKTFTRKNDLTRHIESVHFKNRHACDVPGCSNNDFQGYSRTDKLKEHQKKRHPELGVGRVRK